MLIKRIDALESTTNSRSASLRIDAGKHLCLLLFLASSIFSHFWPASTLLRGHIALAIPSLPGTNPQILEHWGHVDEDHLGKSFQAMGFGLECQRDVRQLL